MFVVHCERCRRRRLLGVNRVLALQNLAPGVIAVQLSCYCGHRAILLTGGGRASLQVTRPG